MKKHILLLLLVIIAVISAERYFMYPAYEKSTATILNFEYGGLSELYRFLISSGFNVKIQNTFKIPKEPHVHVLIAPDRVLDNNYVKNLLTYVSNGGFLIIADELTYVNPLLNQLNIHISGKVIRKLDNVRNNHIIKASCYIGKALVPLTLNKASYLEIRNLSNVLSYCETSEPVFIDINNNGIKDKFEPQHEKVVIGALVKYGNGYVFIISDSSPFANIMLLSNYSGIEHLFLRNLFNYATRSNINPVKNVIIDETHVGYKYAGIGLIPSIIIGFLASIIYTLRFYLISLNPLVTLFNFIFIAILTTLFISWTYGSTLLQSINEVLTHLRKKEEKKLVTSPLIIRYGVESIKYLLSEEEFIKLVRALSLEKPKPSEVIKVVEELKRGIKY